MKSPTIISCVAPTQIGDLVCSLPAARYIKIKFPNSYSVAVLDPRTKELAPLLINHPDIDRIYISQKEEGYTDKEKEWVGTFDFNLPLFGHYVPDEWGNTISPREANFRLRFQFEPNGSPLYSDGWNTLTEDEKKPRLEPWFNFERFDKTIVVAPFVGYNLSDDTTRSRCPSVEWWGKVVEMLINLGFTVVQVGMPKSPLICNESNRYNPKFIDKRNLPLIDSVKIALGAELFIGACGGMSMIVNAYGQRSICPYTNWKKTAISEALLPVNWKNQLIPIYNENINAITLEEVYKAVQQLNP